MQVVKAMLKFKDIDSITKEEWLRITTDFTDYETGRNGILYVRYIPNYTCSVPGGSDKIIEFINSFTDRAEIEIL